ncbi:hypothetical protein HPB48_026916 [Haemaphysalis longicornis]|uniref:Uncharacterized protein n=1 Tax=Haemaphysalis longicornis TaxID=44386 RepID=A0A9J6HAQ0_HAELO|nr:hypothetical protein HPB48_026916 [Haemaphysalis longicornis]
MPTTIANWFAKCSFFRSPSRVHPEPENPEIEDRDRLDAGCTADDFCSADDNLATCGAHTVQDIVEEATCKAADPSHDGDNKNYPDDERLPPPPPPTAKTLHALNILRRAMGAQEIGEDMSTRFYAFERSL